MVDILIVEDDEEMAELIRDFLLKDGYSCKICYCGEEALAFLQERCARIVLLDLMLPGIDGFSVCDELHKKLNIPLIIVSARSSKDDKLSGLKLGADDYIEKPFDIDILRAKIAVLYRRHYAPEPLGYKMIAGELVLNSQKRVASFQGKPMELNQKEFDLLHYLVEHRGKALRKEKLLEVVWGAGRVSELSSTLTVHIKRLRDKIEVDSANPAHILNVWGVGYKYVD
ncbi:MAG: response regulator transcription factor [Peptococcaceae bacterium]|nr:response regulator transcription factor [Peptococcaceae bacterium]